MRFPAKSTSSCLWCHTCCGVIAVILRQVYMPVVRTAGRTGVRSRDSQNFSDGWIAKFSYVWGFARERSAPL